MENKKNTITIKELARICGYSVEWLHKNFNDKQPLLSDAIQWLRKRELYYITKAGKIEQAIYRLKELGGLE